MYHKMLKEICTKHGKNYTKELEAQVNQHWEAAANKSLASGDELNYGGTDRQICENVVKTLGLNISVDELEQELDDLSRTTLPRAPIQKGAERLLNHLHDTKIPFALATNSTRTALRLHIAARPKLFGMFHHTVCVNDPDVDRGKPNPDIYLVAASKFHEKPKPAQCLVFEDSFTGLEAAVGAGMQTVFIPTSPVAGRVQVEKSKKAKVILKTLLDFKPELFGLPPFTNKPEPPKKKAKI